MVSEYDVIWIGTGQATLTVVPKLVGIGKSVAVIEGGQFGGTCVNYGCTPTKTLVASAYAVRMSQRGDEFGFSVTGPAIDFAKVMQPQVENRRATSGWIENRLSELGGCTVHRGYARFVNDRTVEIDGELLTASTIVVHAGTRPTVPDVPGIESVDWLTNETLLDLPALPEHLVIAGGGYIALEFAQIFRRLGARVTVITRGPRLLSREDPDVSGLVEDALAAEGIGFIHNAQIERLSPDGGVTARMVVDGQSQQVTGSHLLFATGRSPNGDRLHVQAAGVETDKAGHILVDDSTRTSVPHIYALGDINGRGAFTHTSVHDGEVFWDHYSRSQGQNANAVELDRKIGDRPFVASMFTDPPLARVGMSESEARASGRSVLLATMPMKSIARAREKRETRGIVKILVDAESDEFVGATVLGTGGDEVVGLFVLAMRSGMSRADFRRTVFPHPTVSELMPWCLDNLQPLS